MIGIKLEEFIDGASLGKLAELHEEITKEHLPVGDTGIPYRVINHWDEKGLIHFKRHSKAGSRRFSFADFIWIQLVAELRSFGVSLPVIKEIASDIYKPLPMKELLGSFSENLERAKNFQDDPAKQDLNEFLKSGEYKEADFSDFQLNYLNVLISEAIETRSPISLLIFKDGLWFPFMKEKEHIYPDDLLRRKEYSSHVTVSVTETIFSNIMEDYLIEYTQWLHLFTKQEDKLLQFIKAGDYKKVTVLFKSKKQEPLEIKKETGTQEQIIQILRERQYKEFILTDSKGKEHRIKESQDEMLSKALLK